MKIRFHLLLFLFTICAQLSAQNFYQPEPKASVWVDSVFNTMNQDEKIAQSFMVAAFSKSEVTDPKIMNLVKDYGLGGIIFMQGNITNQVKLTNEYQANTKVPMLIATDAEWGIGMRLDDGMSFPYQMGLGAIADDQQIYDMGFEIGRQMRRMGMHINFAPVADVNNNPKNPVINYRSFGENREQVTDRAIQYMKGLQDAGIMAVAKHFPGHGDTDSDSHYGLPVISHDRDRLDSVELYPFKKMISAGIGGVMIAHMNVLALDATKNLPSTLSKPIVTDLLKDELGFNGLIFTDAMNMKGVTASNSPGVVDMKAFMAGNDVMEFSEDVPKAIAEIKKAIKKKRISQEEIDRRCKKILAAKHWMGLNQYQPASTENVVSAINTKEAQKLNDQLAASAITILRNDEGALPIDLNKSTATLAINSSQVAPFQLGLSQGGIKNHFYLSSKATAADIEKVKSELADYDQIILGIIQPGVRPRGSFKISALLKSLINDLSAQENTITALFGNPYTLSQFDQIAQSAGLLVAYQNTAGSQMGTAQSMLGKRFTDGKLPVTVNDQFQYGDGITLYSNPTIGAARMSRYLPILEGKGVAMVVNQTSTIADSHLVDSLHNLGVNILKIMSPEHGFRGKADAGEHVKNSIDTKTGIPIVSIYGKDKKPSPEMLEGVDVLIFDIQDAGVRFYTYISTMHYIMEAAAEQEKKVIVLDRPNPNGDYVAGPVLDTAYQSFVGMHPIPIVHGLTVGELAQMINGERWLKGGKRCDLTVIDMENYTHQMAWPLRIAPSPNLPNNRSIRLYPSLCLFEPTTVSIGRGTYTPFQIIGSPEFEGDFSFTPISIDGMSKFPKHQDKECFGVDLTKTDEIPQFTLKYFIDYYSQTKDKEGFFTNPEFFNKLAGNGTLIEQIKDGKSESEITRTWKAELEQYMKLREKYLLYK